MQQYEVIIIGAGASGIMCALNTSQKTLLIEASERVGKKILATGIWNQVQKYICARQTRKMRPP